jgi:hypothetical protein
MCHKGAINAGETFLRIFNILLLIIVDFTSRLGRIVFDFARVNDFINTRPFQILVNVVDNYIRGKKIHLDEMSVSTKPLARRPLPRSLPATA